MRFVTKIGLGAAGTALIIGPLLGTAVFLEARTLLLERIVHEQIQIAAGVMAEIDKVLLDAHVDMNVIAADNFLRDFLESPAEHKGQADMVADELGERANLTGPWNAMTVYNRQGGAVFAPMGPKNGKLAGQDRIAFDNALSGKTYHSDRIMGSADRPVMIFAAPIFGRLDMHKVVGVVVSHYAWTTIQNILDHVERTATVHLFDNRGNMIGHRSSDRFDTQTVPIPPAWKILSESGRGYAILSSTTHGEKATLAVDFRQRGMKGYRGNGWTLMLEMPLDTMLSPIVVMARDTGLLVFGMLLVTGALFAILGRLFVRPLGELVVGVRQVEQGRFDQKVAVHSRDEFGELADSFNAMVGKLQETREELVRKEKLALLGQVAGSVGHELRNPLGVMSNAVYFLQTVLPDADETTREYLNIILDEISRSEHIVEELLDAVRTRPPNLEAVGLTELVEQTLGKCNLPPSVALRLDIPETLPRLHVDAMQIQQVLCNLVSNGVEAMPEGGILEIGAAENNGAVTVSVRDTGSGIAPEVMAKLFQPLFTTKARGIGLGLVVVKNLIEANSGTIDVQSEVGRGTTFSITLPAAIRQDLT